jgi:hypothetical protein
MTQKWREEQIQYVKDYTARRRFINNAQRRIRRVLIQEAWGKVGGPQGTWVNRKWEEAEEYALKALLQEGYTNVKRLKYFPQCFFDIKADKDGCVHVFQVTMRTHCEDLKRHRQLAEDLRLKYHVIYVKPDLSGYLIRDTDCKGVYGRSPYELSLRDLRRLKILK